MLAPLFNDPRRARIGLGAFLCFLGSIPLANWMIQHVGTVCVPNGPCLIPVAPGLMAPSGVLVIGAALVMRDLVQRCLGIWAALVAIGLGTLISVFLAPGPLVLASGMAFLLGELVDCAVYTPLQRRRLVLAVVASSLVGLVVDSAIFLWLAFGDLTYMPGQVVGKAWAIAFAVPLVRMVRRAVPIQA